MKRRRRTVLLVFAALFAVVALVFGWRQWELSKQPRYAGKRISKFFPVWVRQPAQTQLPMIPPNPRGRPRWAFSGYQNDEISALYKQVSTEAIPWLMRELRAGDSWFVRIYIEHERRLPAWLVTRLPYPVAQEHRAWTLQNYLSQAVGRSPTAALPHLAATLKEGNSRQRRVAAQILTRHSAHATALADLLVANLRHDDPFVGCHAFQALLRAHRLDSDAVGEMVIAIEGLQARLRQMNVTSTDILRSLSQHGERARAALPWITTCFTNTVASVRIETVRAALRIRRDSVDRQKVLPVLTATLRDPDRELRSAAIESIHHLFPDTSAALPSVIQSLEDPIARTWAVRILGQFGGESARAVPHFVGFLSDPSDFAGSKELRLACARALGQIGVSNDAVLPALRKAADSDPDSDVRSAATKALRKVTFGAR